MKIYFLISQHPTLVPLAPKSIALVLEKEQLGYGNICQIQTLNFLYSDPQNRIQWRCKYCPKIYLESGGTHAIVTHLEGHGIRESLSKDSKASVGI